MSWEVWGDPPDEQPNPCDHCDEELGSSVGCKLCGEFNRAHKAESELSSLRHTLAHRLRIMRTRKVYEDGNKDNGVSVEMLMSMTLLAGIPGVLHPHEVDPRALAEAEKALLTFENGHCMYSTQPGCNCFQDDKPHPAIHDECCPYRIKFGAAYGLKSIPAGQLSGDKGDANG